MSDARARLPAVHSLLDDAARAGLLDHAPRQVVVDSIRAVLDRARHDGAGEPAGGWVAAVELEIADRSRSSLVRVVNATGVVLHTNLGRAPLADSAWTAAANAYRYSSLEFDRSTGGRGSRQDHVRALVCELTGADDALVVTNAAAAVLLLLNAIAEDGETIVSRGELVEIGGAFRIPAILAKSGSTLIEVGTTNRTRLRDYELALSPRTKLILKVHQSNFQVSGFVEEATLDQLVALGRHRRIPLVHDAGSGLLIDLEPWGLTGEPLVAESVRAGATTVFSGDKLLGGPQAGIVAGPRDVVARAASNPFARAMRPDKFTLAALEATLQLYRDPLAARSAIPTLAMLTADPRALHERARTLADQLASAHLQDGYSVVGGGAFPGARLATTLVCFTTDSPDAMLEALRRHDPPIIARAAEGKVVMDIRTIEENEFPAVVDAVRSTSVR